MECLTSELKWKFFINKYFKNVRAPFASGIELLPRCNFKCIHCYIGSDRFIKKNSLHLDEIYHIIDILVDHNCIEMYFTGGECLLHENFCEIYEYAKKKGLLLTVLTNGSLISEKHINLWNEYPPERISISLYGISKEIYYDITGVQDSFEMVMNSIELLKKNKIKYELKIIGMKQNYNEILEMRNFIRSQGQMKSILAWDIRPTNEKNTSPIQCRVTPTEAMNIEILDPERNEFYKMVAKDKTRHNKTNRQNNGYLYPCSAGYQFVFITHEGFMQSCVKAVHPRYNLIKGTFDAGWEFIKKEFVDKKASNNFKCLSCDKFKFCGQCSAAFYLENGNPEKPSTFYCELGRLRDEYMDTIENQTTTVNK